MKAKLSNKAPGGYLGLISILIAAICGVVYYNYGTGSDMLNSYTVIFLLLGIACEGVCVVWDVGILPLAAVVSFSISLGFFVRDSIGSYIDYLFNIAMFGDASKVGIISVILGMMLAVLVLEIASCFMKRSK